MAMVLDTETMNMVTEILCSYSKDIRQYVKTHDKEKEEWLRANCGRFKCCADECNG